MGSSRPGAWIILSPHEAQRPGGVRQAGKKWGPTRTGCGLAGLRYGDATPAQNGGSRLRARAQQRRLLRAGRRPSRPRPRDARGCRPYGRPLGRGHPHPRRESAPTAATGDAQRGRLRGERWARELVKGIASPWPRGAQPGRRGLPSRSPLFGSDIDSRARIDRTPFRRAPQLHRSLCRRRTDVMKVPSRPGDKSDVACHAVCFGTF